MVRIDVFEEWGWPEVVADTTSPRLLLADILRPADEVAALFL